MSELIVILGRNYENARRWLQDNHKRMGLDPQQCRILTNPEALKGLKDYTLIKLRGWGFHQRVQAFQFALTEARAQDRIKKEISI